MTRICVALCLGLGLVLGAAAARASDVLRSISVSGVERSYLLHLPPIAGSGVPLPLVVVLHGRGGDARVTAALTGFSDEADWRGFAVAYPNGTNGEVAPPLAPERPKLLVWNAGLCCGWAVDHAVDDVRFVRTLVAAIAREVAIDRQRVYATGLSNGGMMAYRLACDASDVFAAVGVVSGALVTPGCAPSEPVSVIQLHGSADEILPIAGGPGGPGGPAGMTYPSAQSAIAFWSAADGCDSKPSESRPAPGIRLARYGGCRAGTAIEYYELEAGKHSWPGGDRVAVPLAPALHRFAATPVLWDFFASHPKRPR